MPSVMLFLLFFPNLDIYSKLDLQGVSQNSEFLTILLKLFETNALKDLA